MADAAIMIALFVGLPIFGVLAFPAFIYDLRRSYAPKEEADKLLQEFKGWPLAHAGRAFCAAKRLFGGQS